MKRLVAIILLMLGCLHLSAQDIIMGVVLFEKDNEPAVGLNVILRRNSDESVIAFAQTDNEGCFSIQCKEKSDGLWLLITGIDVEMTEYPLGTSRQNLRIVVKSAPLSITEAKVKAPPFSMKSDTLSFAVAQYKVESDRSIADVLRKMPGIDVSKSGQVTYNGKEINRFYIEGMDMLGSGYGVASNGLRADDIASVDVYTRHQPIRALEDIESTDQAALNLRLKEKTRGAILGNAQVGVGYTPFMGDAEALGMYFGKSLQALASVKANNEGNDIVAREIDPLDDILSSSSTGSHLSVSKPSTPNIDRSRYLDNRIVASSANVLKRIGDEDEVVVKASYIHDLQKSSGSTASVYHFNDGSLLELKEIISNKEKSDKMNFSSAYKKNSSRRYLNETLDIIASRVGSESSMDGGGDIVGQDLSSPDMRISNKFNDLFRVGKQLVSVSSDISYDCSNSSLQVMNSPFATSTSALVAQTLMLSNFRTDNEVRYQYNTGLVQLGIRGGVNYAVSALEGHLTENDKSLSQQEGELGTLDVVLTPSFGYDLGSRFKATVTAPIVLRGIRYMGNSDTYVFVQPSFRVSGELSSKLSFMVSGGHRQSDGGVFDVYSGQMMTTYRLMSSSSGVLPKTRTFSIRPSLEYKNAKKGLISNLGASYSRGSRSHILSDNISKESTQVEQVSKENSTSSGAVNLRIAKRLDYFSTTVHFNSGYSSLSSEFMRQGVLSATRNDAISVRLSVETRFSSKLNAEASTSYNHGKMSIGGNTLTSRNFSESILTLNYIPVSDLVFTGLVENYIVSSTGMETMNMTLADISVRRVFGRTTISLEGKNLLNTKEYRSISISDALTKQSIMRLRPASVILRLKRDF